MNKSKFLKKSLAMLLAVMLVVAMIPMSASAADVPAVSKLTVQNEGATLSGDTFSAEISPTGISSNTDVTIVVVLAAGAGKVFHDGAMVPATNNQYEVTPTTDEYTAKAVEFSVWDTDVQNSKTYKVQWTYLSQSSDNALASIAFKDGKNQYGTATQEDGVTVLTTSYAGVNTATAAVVAKVNEKATVASSDVTVTKTADGTFELVDYTVGTEFRLTVTAENNASRTYTVKVVAPKYFTAFSVAGERKEAKIDEDQSEITAYLPYDVTTVKKNGTEYYEITANFNAGYPSASVKSLNTTYPASASAKVFTTGNKLYVEKSVVGSGIVLDYYYPTFGASVAKSFTLNLDIPSADPKAEISALKIGNYLGKVDGKNITVELPATFMASNASASLQVKASAGASVDLVGDTAKVASADGDAYDELKAAYDTSKETTAIIRVTSGWTEGGTVSPAVNDYNLIVKKVAVSQGAAVKAMILENPDGEQYKATIDDTNNLIKFAVPYSTAVTDLTTAQTWKLYYETSSGAVLTAPADVASGDVIVTATGAIFPTKFDGKTADGSDVKVTADDNSTKTYKVVVSLMNPATGKSIESFNVTAETANDDLTDDNTYKGTVSGTNVTVNVPYSKYTGTKADATTPYNFASANAIVPVMKLSEGATAYYLGKSDEKTDTTAATKLVGVDEDTAGTAISVQGKYFNGEVVNSSDSTLRTLTVVVASEGATALTTFDDSWKGANAGKFTVYKLAVKQQKANKTAAFATVTLFDAVTKETVSGKVSGTQITFDNIPNHFIADSKAGAADAGVFIDFKVNKGEAVGTAKNNLFAPITYEDDGSYKAGGKKVTFNDAVTPVSADVSSLYIESEDGNKGTASATEHGTSTVYYNFATAEKGAVMTSMTINNVTGKPDTNNKIEIVLPYGTEVTALKPSFVVSKYAKVTYSGAQILSGNTAINFTAPQKFVVTSEDGKNTTTYTVSVSTSAQFSDVKVGDWFYDDVMAAASRGIIVGIGNGKFNPKGNVTRGQFATMMARVDGFDKDAYMDKTPFSDVKGGTETSAAIAYAAEKGYITGYGDTTFKPNKNITREEMASILCKFMGLTQVTDSKTKFADDAKIAGWAKGYVYACAEAGILKGDKNQFDPKGLTTRAQAATVAVRVDDAK